jgi:hypothetical protein
VPPPPGSSSSNFIFQNELEALEIIYPCYVTVTFIYMAPIIIATAYTLRLQQVITKAAVLHLIPRKPYRCWTWPLKLHLTPQDHFLKAADTGEWQGQGQG